MKAGQPFGTRQRSSAALFSARSVEIAPAPGKRAPKAFSCVPKGILRAVAFNSRTPGAAFGLAFNASVPAVAPESAADWLLLAPYHEGPYRQPPDPRTYTQIFTRPQAEKMVAAFNALATAEGATFPGLPVYAGHPDCLPDRWPDERRLGSVVNLAVRKDGLYVKVAWNSLGRENLTERLLCYPSPAWNYSLDEAQRTGRIEPDELQSVGMTNSPRIRDAVAWTNCAPGSGAVAPGFRSGAVNTVCEADLSTPAGRRRAFNQRLDELTKPIGGRRGMTFNAAIAEMQSNPGDAPLLGADHKPQAKSQTIMSKGTATNNAGGGSVQFPGAKLLGHGNLTGVDISTPEARAQAFKARTDALTRPTIQGGGGMSLKDAVAHMRGNPQDAALLKAMGA